MDQLLTVVLDVGKTLSKASLWDQGGQLIARQARPNPRIDVGAYAALDIEGIEAWLLEVLSGFARQGPISALIPVGHGAAAVIVRDGRPVCAPMDYESPVPESVRQSYLPARDAFALSGSPALPGGLNLGLQLAWLEQLHPGILHAGSRLLLWPQYWAWRLSGVAAAEVQGHRRLDEVPGIGLAARDPRDAAVGPLDRCDGVHRLAHRRDEGRLDHDHAGLLA